MIIYDFCKTIVKNNSLDDFIFYILESEKNKKKLRVFNFLNSIPVKILQKMNIISWKFKKNIKIGLLKGLHKNKLELYSQKYANYLYEKESNWLVIDSINKNCEYEKIVVISAGLDCYISKYMQLICKDTIVISNNLEFVGNIATGKMLDKDCYGEAKVQFFKALYPNQKVVKTYSDCLSDMPIFMLAEKKYLVLSDEIRELKI